MIGSGLCFTHGTSGVGLGVDDDEAVPVGVAVGVAEEHERTVNNEVVENSRKRNKSLC